MFVKICGITTRAALEAAVAAGADAVGFVFTESPRQVTAERARELCADLPEGIVRVGVLHRPTAALWAEVLGVFAPDWLQSDVDDFARHALPAVYRPLPVYRAAPATAELPERLLFEGAVSGSGERADWTAARGLAQRTQLILAGGLTADNIVEAVERVRPWGVDVSSGVERRRGEKDPALIDAFIARVRELESDAARAAREER